MTEYPPVQASAVRPPVRQHGRLTLAPLWTVEQYAERLLDGHAVADVLAELAQRIDAHAEHNGCCGNGCNVRGWQLPFPCETRQFYEAVREHLSSSVDKAANTFAASEVDVQPDDGWAGG